MALGVHGHRHKGSLPLGAQLIAHLSFLVPRILTRISVSFRFQPQSRVILQLWKTQEISLNLRAGRRQRGLQALGLPLMSGIKGDIW